jgi:small subunit ribosomal protein S1
MAEELDTKKQSEEQASDEQAETTAEATSEDAPTTLDQADPAEAEAADTESTDESADDAEESDESLLDKAKDVVEDAVDAAEEAVEDAAETVTTTSKRLLDQAVDSAKEAVADAAEAVSEGADTVAQRITGSTEQVNPDAPVAVESPDALDYTGGSLGYTGEIQGNVISLADLEDYENSVAPEQPEDKDELLTQMYERSMTEVAEGEIVTGRVASIGEKEIVIDIGFKSDGIVSKNEFDHELEIGEEIDVFLERLEDRYGQLTLSKTKADDVRRWEKIEGAYENEGILEGTIIRRIKGGMIVDLLGAEAFLPGSQIDARPVRDFDAYLGKTMEYQVVKINASNGNVVVSHKALIMKDLEEQRDKILDSMEVGQVLEGQVKNIVDFGVFIDLGGVDGLLHITDLSWGRVGHPSEVVELDQKLNIVVLNYEKERQRISLGLKQLMPHPWENIEEKFAEGQVVQGRVVSITDYGAFVELEKGIEGLVHISEMSYTEHIKHPTQKVQLGQIVDVKVLNIDTEEKKISLGMKQLEADPWEGILERYSVGQTATGIVRNITSFGAFVELEPGIDGLVHVSDLSWTKRIKHPSEVVRKGQDLDIQILDIDVAQRRLSLGHKQVQTDPWQQYATAYEENSDTMATVTEVTSDGLRVELPLEAPGFVPASHLERGGDPTMSYQEGDELELRVIRLDRSKRDIILSETAKRMAAERAERHAERSEQVQQRREEQKAVQQFQTESRGPATIGELSGLEALKAKMEAQEAAAEGPVGEEPSESQSAAVEAEVEGEPVQTEGKGSTAMEDKVGMGNRGSIGKDPDEMRDTAQLEHPTEPSAKRTQRVEEGGDYPPAEKSQAALKTGDLPEEGTLAADAEDATDDVTPTTAATAEPEFEGPNVDSPDDVETPEMMDQPADEAVAEATGSDDEEEGTSAEMGKADATVTGDDAEAVAEEAEEEKEA